MSRTFGFAGMPAESSRLGGTMNFLTGNCEGQVTTITPSPDEGPWRLVPSDICEDIVVQRTGNTVRRVVGSLGGFEISFSDLFPIWTTQGFRVEFDLEWNSLRPLAFIRIPRGGDIELRTNSVGGVPNSLLVIFPSGEASTIVLPYTSGTNAARRHRDRRKDARLHLL